MSEEPLCCRELAQTSRRSPPFDRAIVLGWYDGPTDGLVRCGACHRVYPFDMLDAVDEDRGIRVYRLAPLPTDSMARLIEVLSRFKAPSWPMWAPLWKFPTEADRVTADRAVNDLMAKADSPELVVTTTGLLNEILDVKVLSASDTGQVRDWVSWMELVRAPA